MTIKELQEKRNQLAGELRKLNEKFNASGKKWTDEERTNFEKCSKDYDENMVALNAAVEEERKQADIAKRMDQLDDDDKASTNYRGLGLDDRRVDRNKDDRKIDPNHDIRLSISAWALNQSKPSLITDEMRQACQRTGTHIGDKEIAIRLDPDGQIMQRGVELYRDYSREVASREVRALSTQIGQTGGYTIAPNFSNAIESAMLYFGPMLQVATPLRTTTAADYPFMTDNETTKTGSYVGENTNITTAEGVTIRQVVFHAYKATTNAILVPYELLRDTSINLPSYLQSKLGERMGRFVNTETTTGAIKCIGIVTASTAGVTAASATAIAFDEVISLEHSVDIAYRNSPGVGYMMHDNVVLHIRKLKDGQGNYLWTNGTQAGQPDRINGKPLRVNNDMASSVATGAKTILFGDFSKYYLRTVGEIRMAMTDQRYWEYDQTAFAAYMYFDGNLIDAGTHPVKHLVQA